jgi:uroporphyrinogen decarboxylase
MNKPINRKPDFKNLAAVLEKKVPSRPTLFEFFLNVRLERKLAGERYRIETDIHSQMLNRVDSFEAAGYDYVTILCPNFWFINAGNTQGAMSSKSLNAGGILTSRKQFDNYTWANPDNCEYDFLDKLSEYLPQGMKAIVYAPNGVLENAVDLIGYDNLCMMLYDDPDLVSDIFEQIGDRIYKYYKRSIEYDCVGAILYNDDWGFNTQTLLSPENLRKYVFPWAKKIVAAAHEKGKYGLLHSCGYYGEIIDDIINDMKFDGKHSYEDTIIPVEKAYDDLKGKIAVLGGMDVNFMATAGETDIYNRAKAMLEKASLTGGYALGTGNSVPEYIPDDNYFAMIKAAY